MKCRVMKYDGDDMYSWAVFKAEDVKGMCSPIMYGQAKPLVAGCSRNEANYYKSQYENKQK